MKCPKCRHEFDYREGEVEEEWRKIIQLLPAFNGHGRLVMEYVEKFGVTPLAIKTKKMLRLLEEVGALFVQKKFSFQKRVYTVSESGIKEGLTVVCNKHFERPLENHNYLKKVLMDISAKEAQERMNAREAELRRKEKGINDGRQPTADGSREEYLSREEVARLAGQVVRNMEGREEG